MGEKKTNYSGDVISIEGEHLNTLLVLLSTTKCVVLVQSRHHHHLIEN